MAGEHVLSEIDGGYEPSVALPPINRKKEEERLIGALERIEECPYGGNKALKKAKKEFELICKKLEDMGYEGFVEPYRWGCEYIENCRKDLAQLLDEIKNSIESIATEEQKDLEEKEGEFLIYCGNLEGMNYKIYKPFMDAYRKIKEKSTVGKEMELYE